eukprot:153084_1
MSELLEILDGLIMNFASDAQVNTVAEMKHTEQKEYFTLLCADVIRHILSFINDKIASVKLVNKMLNQLAIDIEPKLPKELQQRLKAAKKAKLFKYKTKFNKNKNTIWIVHQNPINKSVHKLKRKIKIVNTKNLKDLFGNNRCKKGDTILVYNGEYSFFESDAKIKCDLKFIGMEHNVYFKGNIHCIPSYCNVYFKNINFLYSEDPKHPASYRLMMESHSGLWLKDCLINFDFIGIKVDGSCSLNVKNCKFVGKGTAINLYSIADYVNIIGCIFTNCDRYCINIRNDVTHFRDKYVYHDTESEEENESDDIDFLGMFSVSKTFVEMRCIGNLFKCENGCIGVGWLSEDVSMELHSETAQQIKYTFSHNFLRYQDKCQSDSEWKYKSITDRNVNHYESW